MKLFSMTDIGKRREINEDYLYASKEAVGNLDNLFMVADGMGGHNAGDFASKNTVWKVVEAIGSYKDDFDAENIMQKAIDDANSYIYKMARENEALRGMGTTLVTVTCKGETATVANVGDSRMYLVNDEIKQITKDHSLVQEMIDLGGLEKDRARNHPDKNIITRAIGVREYVLVDFFEVHINEGDRLLLCSDGLTNMLRDEEIHRIIRQNEDISKAGEKLVKAANNNGGRDNIAVVLVEPFGGQYD